MNPKMSSSIVAQFECDGLAIETVHPAGHSFHMPGEFEPHDRCWVAWPHRPDIWRNNASQAQVVFSTLVKEIAKFEPVNVLVSKMHWSDAQMRLGNIPGVAMIHCETDDSWARDTGPSFVVKEGEELRGVDWIFNAWGGFYMGDCCKKDDLVASTVLQSLGMMRYKAPLVLEGGSIHVDGAGTLITTEECLLNKNRNPDKSRAEIENLLMQYTGSKKVIWLESGVYADHDTNGHVDNLCFFVRPGLVALLWTDDESDPQYSRR